MENKKLQEGFSRFKIENYNNSHDGAVNAPVPSDPNEAIRFDNKTDEEIVYASGHKTLRPIDYLIRNAKDSKPAKRRAKSGKTPRRLNNWIIYRRDKSVDPRFKGLKPEIVARKVSRMWKKEPKERKEFYSALARLAEKEHKLQFGEDYRYQPGPSKQDKKKTNKKRKESKKENKPNTQTTATPTPAAQQLLTPVTSNSSPVLEQQSPVKSMQSFPLLSEINTLPEELSTPESQQQYLLTPVSTPYSPISTQESVAEFPTFPSNTELLTPESQQQYLLTPVSTLYSPISTQDSVAEFSTFPSPVPELEPQFLEATTSSFEQENIPYVQYNAGLLELLQQEISLLPTNLSEVPDTTQYNGTLFDDGDIAVHNLQFDATKCNDFTHLGNGIAVQQLYDNNYGDFVLFENDDIDAQQYDYQFDSTKYNDNNDLTLFNNGNLFEGISNNDMIEQQCEQDFDNDTLEYLLSHFTEQHQQQHQPQHQQIQQQYLQFIPNMTDSNPFKKSE